MILKVMRMRGGSLFIHFCLYYLDIVFLPVCHLKTPYFARVDGRTLMKLPVGGSIRTADNSKYNCINVNILCSPNFVYAVFPAENRST